MQFSKRFLAAAAFLLIGCNVTLLAQTTITKGGYINDGVTPSIKATVTGANALKVDGSGVTQQVSGTVTTTPPANASTNIVQANGTTVDTNSGLKSAGTFRFVLATDQPALTNALKVDGSAVTQPVSGTFWQAVQPVSESGNWSMRLQGNAGAILDFAGQNAAAPANAILTGGEFNTSPTTLTTGDASPLQLDSAANLLVDLKTAIPAGGNTIGAVTQASGPWTSNETQLGGTAIDTNSGLKSAGTQRMVLATDQPALTNALKVDPSGVTSPVSGTVTANQGGNWSMRLQGNAGAILDFAGQNAAAPANSVLIGGEFNTSPTTITSGNASPLQLDNAGDLLAKINVALPTGGNTIGAVTQASGPWTSNETQLGGTAIDTNSGNKSAGTQRMVLATDQPALTNALKVDPSGVTSPVSGSGNFNVVGTKTNNNAAPGATNVGVLPAIANAAAPTYTEGDQVLLSTDLSGNVRVTGSLSVGGTTDNSAYTAGTSSGTPSFGFYHSTIDSVTDGRSAALAIDSKRNLFTVIRDAADNARGVNVTSGNALTVDGSAVTQPVSGTVTANQGGNWSMRLQGNAGAILDFAGQNASAPANAILTGGEFNTSPTTLTTGDASPLQLDSSANLLVDLKTAIPTGGNTIGAVTQASGPWTENITQINGNAVSTAATGVQKVGTVGNAGATLDSAIGGATAPANDVTVGGVYNNATPVAPTDGQAAAIQLDQAGNTRVFWGVSQKTLSAQGTAQNSTQTIFTNSGAESVLVQLTQTTTLTAGAITFEVTYDGTTWSTIPANDVLDPTSATFAQIAIPYTVQASTNKQFLLLMNGASGLRIKTSTAITGTGSVTPNYTLQTFNPFKQAVVFSPTAANFNAMISGTEATNVAITDNPINLGAQAVTSENAAITTARKAQLVSDAVGKLIVLPYANPENFVSGAITTAMTGTTSTSLIAAPASGLRNYITQITVSNSHATVGTDIIIQDGNGGTTLYTIPAAAAYGGAVISFPTPLRQPTTATAIYCANVTTGSNTKVSASGYKGQ